MSLQTQKYSSIAKGKSISIRIWHPVLYLQRCSKQRVKETKQSLWRNSKTLSPSTGTQTRIKRRIVLPSIDTYTRMPAYNPNLQNSLSHLPTNKVIKYYQIKNLHLDLNHRGLQLTKNNFHNQISSDKVDSHIQAKQRNLIRLTVQRI